MPAKKKVNKAFGKTTKQMDKMLGGKGTAKKISKKIFTPKKLPTDTDVIMPGRKYPKSFMKQMEAQRKKPKKAVKKK